MTMPRLHPVFPKYPVELTVSAQPDGWLVVASYVRGRGEPYEATRLIEPNPTYARLVETVGELVALVAFGDEETPEVLEVLG